MNDYLLNILNDNSLYAWELLRFPRYNTSSGESYRLRIRPLKKDGRWIKSGNAEFVLTSDEFVPIEVTGFAYMHRTPEARRSGRWTLRDQLISIRIRDMTKAQAQQASLIVQRQVHKR